MFRSRLVQEGSSQGREGPRRSSQLKQVHLFILWGPPLRCWTFFPRSDPCIFRYLRDRSLLGRTFIKLFNKEACSEAVQLLLLTQLLRK